MSKNGQDSPDDSVNEKQKLIPKSRNQVLHDVKIFILVLVMLLAYCLVLLSAQVSALKANIFQLNSLRFGLQLVLITPVIIYKGYSMKIEPKYIHLLAGYVIGNILFSSCFYFAASFMPVGNLHNLFVSFFILISTVYDFIKRDVNWKTVIIALTAMLGIILLAQPWNDQNLGELTTVSPCEYLDTYSGDTHNLSDVTSGFYLQVNVTKLESSGGLKSKAWFQYIFIILCAILNTVACNMLRRLVLEYANLTIMFWSALFEGLISFVINMIWTALIHGSFYAFPPGKFCLLFSCCFIVCSASVNSLTFYTFQYITISTDAINNAFVAILLYISQRTFLKNFHPGHANLVEVLGVVIVIFSAAVLQFLFLLLGRIKSSKHS